MSARLLALAVAFVALATLPYWMPGIYYINVASQILFYAIFALGLNVLVGYAGLVSLGHAGLFGIAAYATGYMLQLGYGHTAAILVALVIGVASMAIYRRAVAALDRHRLHHDHAGAGRNPLGPRLSLDQPDRRRQRHQRARPARRRSAIRSPTPNTFYYATLVIFLLSRRGDGGVRALAVRRRADGHARPAAPHERARLSRLGDPLLRLPVLRAADRRVRHPVRLLHAVHQPADARRSPPRPRCC